MTAAAPGVAVPVLPPEAPLAMPEQSFTRWSRERRDGASRLARGTLLSRLFVFGGGALVTAWGVSEMFRVVAVGGITALEWLLLALFAVNFSWIAVAFTGGVLGFASLLRRAPPEAVEAGGAEPKGRTAVLMPIYNEAPSRVFGALEAMARDLHRVAPDGPFDVFVLSDTTDPDVWIAEERAHAALVARLPDGPAVYYRHRLKNTARKAGNVADWVRRWGGAYECMVVLDADSLMTGESITGLARAMAARPELGILQTLPLIINRNTLFARLQQFAARVYGPVIAEGLRLWMGRDGNYWGHNAIIRVRPFADHCGLPDLAGRPPFGGHVLSHDFVEAALMRRAGWAVAMTPGLVGSFEESPPSLIDLAARDRRWCQGNLQHLRVLGARGLKLASRQHFATGIMAYLASPFWLGQLVVGLALALQARLIRPEYFTRDFSLFPAWPRFDAERALTLFGITMAILLAPKVFGLLLALARGPVRRACGGGVRLTLSFLLEVLLSAMLAPVMMMIQSGAVFSILLGRDSGWRPQRRDDGSIPLRDILRRHRGHVAFGLVVGASALLIAPSLFGWMSPTVLGLVLSVPLSAASGSLAIGLWLRRRGLLVTPEEGAPPAIAAEASRLQAGLAAQGGDDEDGLARLHADPAFRDHHLRALPPAPRRRRGVIDPDRAVAEAKMIDAASIEEARQWLGPAERRVVMADRALLSILAALPSAAGDEAAAGATR